MARRAKSETVEIPRALFEALGRGLAEATNNDMGWASRHSKETNLIKAALAIVCHVWRNGKDGRTPPKTQRYEPLRERAEASPEISCAADTLQEESENRCRDREAQESGGVMPGSQPASGEGENTTGGEPAGEGHQALRPEPPRSPAPQEPRGWGRRRNRGWR
ncbi:MAG: hypothetical protein PWP23_2368 [Candidatus Sumerlaeota bacterium]|nr:hypothetical protein [Candidatus Sumerlaeota bacterium]